MENLITVLSSIDSNMNWWPDWASSSVLLLLAILFAWWLHSMLFPLIERWFGGDDLFRRSLLTRTRGATRLAFILAAIAIAVGIAPLTWQQASLVWDIEAAGMVLLFGWGLTIALHVWTVIYLRRFSLDSEDNLLARKHVTQSRILERIAKILIVVLTIGAALMTFDGVRQYGVSLLASAGAAGLVVGLALQPMLKNLIAGFQLAVTQPIRIDDALLVEGEWGNVEEITSSYVVVKLWDWRRMIVPLSYFIETPFQNWTRENASLIGTVYLYTDFTVPAQAVREKLEEVARNSSIWDGKVVNLQVTDFKETTMELRMLVSAKDAPRTFDLRCEVREKMIAWLQEEYPNALPRTRAELEQIPESRGGRSDGFGDGSRQGVEPRNRELAAAD
ncbi:mechanosensitive ion channel family protein [Methyloligella halotolerans]|uniref:mechanosensitive ion channel family protein n=1 Tax=Methyloligella halotolerans TaxID=1177755 RepID=UPI00083DFF9E|nr:mechanosensitive ion channel family protein [Methyloligella halotolerans]